MAVTTGIDRLGMRARPEGRHVMEQTWDDLLFLHWPIDPATIRPLIPAYLDIDFFEGQAWLSITPFRVNHIRFLSLPEVPGLDSFIELNVRTYVHHNGVPGVWFFSLDASKLLPTIAARLVYLLPYYKSEMSFNELDGDFSCVSKRVIPEDAEFGVRWRVGATLPDPDPESLAFFLVERYALFAGNETELLMTRVYHPPWGLKEAVVSILVSTMTTPLRFSPPSGPPLVHFSRTLHVEIWPPTPVVI